MARAAVAPRPRRAPLSRERVLRAAVRIADREGIGAVSMRRIGQALGVEAMALYNHVANKDEILDGMVDLVVNEIDPPIDGADWRATLRARILSAREALLRHPWAAAAMASRGQMTPTVMRYMESTGAIFRNGGFSLELTHHAFHVLGSRILGFVQELYDDSDKLAETPEMMAIMAEEMADEFPVMTEIATKVSHDETNLVGTGCDYQWEFEFGLDIMLDGLERARVSEA